MGIRLGFVKYTIAFQKGFGPSDHLNLALLRVAP